VLIPVLMIVFLKIHEHYREIRPQLSMKGYTPSPKITTKPRVVMPVSGVHRGTMRALEFARSITDDITALYIEIDLTQTERFKQDWAEWCGDVPLEVVDSPYRSILIPLLAFLDHTDRVHDDGQHAILVMPEFIPGSWWQHFLHNQTAWMIRIALLYQRRRHRRERVIIEVPFLLEG
jgi:hypothetical protein